MKLCKPDECTACMACVASCKHGALSLQLDKKGFFEINANQDKCVDCGLCTYVCPVINSPGKTNNFKCEPFATWSTNESLRALSASGGAFAAIAETFLKEGGVVYGAAIDGFKVKHIRVSDIEELPRILGSKYQHSEMGQIYNLIKRDLSNNLKVLFSGLSCQCAGVYNTTNKKQRENLFLIDTICGGVSTMLPMKSLEKSGLYTRIISFRDKENGWKSNGFKYALKMESKDGNICNLGTDNLVLKCFVNKLTKRSSCLDCNFNGIERISDCTIGDFWGDNRFVEEHKSGLSVIIQNSDRLSYYLKNSTLKMHQITWRECIKSNPCYYWTHYPYLRHCFLRKKIQKLLIKGDFKEIERILDTPGTIEQLDIRLYMHLNESKRKDKLLKLLCQFKEI